MIVRERGSRKSGGKIGIPVESGRGFHREGHLEKWINFGDSPTNEPRCKGGESQLPRRAQGADNVGGGENRRGTNHSSNGMGEEECRKKGGEER